VTKACAFLGDGMSRAEALEPAIHGRGRKYDETDLSEAHFGVHERIVLARGTLRGAQWTGVATGVALAMLESGAVDAVIVAASADDMSGFGSPVPLLCRTADEVLRGRRVKPSLCPSLAVLDEVTLPPHRPFTSDTARS
jgi:coenzyme F420-reducing hydrogenase beta subunit